MMAESTHVTYHLSLTVCILTEFQDVLIHVGNYGVNIQDVLMHVGNYGVSIQDQLGLEGDISEDRAGARGTHVEDVKDSVEVQIPTRNLIFVVP